MHHEKITKENQEKNSLYTWFVCLHILCFQLTLKVADIVSNSCKVTFLEMQKFAWTVIKALVCFVYHGL